MANAIFPIALEGFLAAEIDLDTAAVKAMLVRGYTYSASHKFVSDVTGSGATIHATSGALASKTVAAGVFDASDLSGGSAIATAANASNHGVLLVQTSAVGGGADVAASAQRVIAWYDTGTNLPIVPPAGTVEITWDNGTNKIFKLG